MSYIVDFFKALGDIISSIIDFIVSMITGLVDFTLMIPEYVDMLTDLIEQLPGELVGFASLTLAAALIFLVIGRRGT